MFTGRYPSHHGHFADEMEMSGTPIAAVLADTGYTTFSVNTSAKLAGHSPLSAGFETCLELFRLPFVPSTFEELDDYYLSMLVPWIHFAYRRFVFKEKVPFLVTAALRAQMKRATDRESPFFGFVNYLSAHSPYDPPEPFRSEFTGSSDPADPDLVESLATRGGYRVMAGEVDPAASDWRAVKDRYDGEIAYIDREIARLFRRLRSLDIYDETMIIVTADHGEHFGEHGLAYHQFSLFDELLHVPLLIKFPGNEYAGKTVDNLVSLVDIYPTVLDVIDVDGINDYDGRSLYPPEASGHDAVFAEYLPKASTLEALETYAEREVPGDVLDRFNRGLQCVRTSSHKYVRVTNGRDRLYDLGNDRYERHDLLEEGDGSPGTVAEDLSERIDSTLSELPKATPTQASYDAAVMENLRELGYI